MNGCDNFMVDRKEPKLIKKSGDIGLWIEEIEMNDGSFRKFIVITDVKTANYMKGDKGKNMFDVTWKTKEYYSMEKLNDLREVFKT